METPELSKEEKEKLLSEKMDAIRKRNEEILRRHKEIEADIQLADKHSASVHMDEVKPYVMKPPRPRPERVASVSEQNSSTEDNLSVNSNQECLISRQRLTQNEGPPPDPSYRFLADPDRDGSDDKHDDDKGTDNSNRGWKGGRGKGRGSGGYEEKSWGRGRGGGNFEDRGRGRGGFESMGKDSGSEYEERGKNRAGSGGFDYRGGRGRGGFEGRGRGRGRGRGWRGGGRGSEFSERNHQFDNHGQEQMTEAGDYHYQKDFGRGSRRQRRGQGQQRAYENWKAERNAIDEARLTRARSGDGVWRREWDMEKKDENKEEETEDSFVYDPRYPRSKGEVFRVSDLLPEAEKHRMEKHSIPLETDVVTDSQQRKGGGNRRARGSQRGRRGGHSTDAGGDYHNDPYIPGGTHHRSSRNQDNWREIEHNDFTTPDIQLDDNAKTRFIENRQKNIETPDIPSVSYASNIALEEEFNGHNTHHATYTNQCEELLREAAHSEDHLPLTETLSTSGVLSIDDSFTNNNSTSFEQPIIITSGNCEHSLATSVETMSDTVDMSLKFEREDISLEKKTVSDGLEQSEIAVTLTAPNDNSEKTITCIEEFNLLEEKIERLYVGSSDALTPASTPAEVLEQTEATSLEIQGEYVHQMSGKGLNTYPTEPSTSITECNTGTADSGIAISKCSLVIIESGIGTAECDTIIAAASGIGTVECSTVIAEAGTTTAECSTAVAEAGATTAECSTVVAEVCTTTAECSTVVAEAGTTTAERSTVVAEAGTTTAERSTVVAEVGTTTAECSTVVAEAGTTTAECSTVIAEGGTSTAECSTTVVAEAGTTTAECSTVVAEVGTTTAERSTVVAEAGTTTAECSTVVAEAGTTTAECSTVVAEAGTTTAECSTVVAEAGTTTAERTTVVAEAGTTTAERSTVVAEVGTTTAERTTVVAEAGTTTAECTTVVAEAGTTTAERTTVVAEAGTTTAECSTVIAEGGTSTAKCSAVVASSGASIAECSTVIAEHSTGTVKPSISNNEISECTADSSTCTAASSTCGAASSTDANEPSTGVCNTDIVKSCTHTFDSRVVINESVVCTADFIPNGATTYTDVMQLDVGVNESPPDVSTDSVCSAADLSKCATTDTSLDTTASASAIATCTTKVGATTAEFLTNTARSDAVKELWPCVAVSQGQETHASEAITAENIDVYAQDSDYFTHEAATIDSEELHGDIFVSKDSTEENYLDSTKETEKSCVEIDDDQKQIKNIIFGKNLSVTESCTADTVVCPRSIGSVISEHAVENSKSSLSIGAETHNTDHRKKMMASKSAKVSSSTSRVSRIVGGKLSDSKKPPLKLLLKPAAAKVVASGNRTSEVKKPSSAVPSKPKLGTTTATAAVRNRAKLPPSQAVTGKMSVKAATDSKVSAVSSSGLKSPSKRTGTIVPQVKSQSLSKTPLKSMSDSKSQVMLVVAPNVEGKSSGTASPADNCQH